jgi:hypothetical protein
LQENAARTAPKRAKRREHEEDQKPDFTSELNNPLEIHDLHVTLCSGYGWSDEASSYR